MIRINGKQRSLRIVLLATLVVGLAAPGVEARSGSPAPAGRPVAAVHAKSPAVKPVQVNYLNDPFLQAVLRWRLFWDQLSEFSNAGGMWVDVTDLPEEEYLHLIQNSPPGSKGNPPAWQASLLRTGDLMAEDYALYEGLNLGRGRTVLQILALSAAKGDQLPGAENHMEEVLKTRSGATLWAKRQLIASEREPCPGRCATLTQDRPARYAVKYGTKLEQKASAPELKRNITAGRRAISEQEEDDRKAQQQEEQELQQKAFNPEPPSSCATALPSGAHRPLVLAAALPLAADCDGEKSPASGLGQSLARAPRELTPGGVDFSSLQLNYLSDDPGTGISYAFRADAAASGTLSSARSGFQAVEDSSADLFTWLALRPDTFWVNLNPNEPDRIIDAKLGQTNAGRALLEADLRMKRTETKLLDPDTRTGSEFWSSLTGGSGGTVCFTSRMWIEPGRVEVREDGNALYILKAPLIVKTEAEHLGGEYTKDCPNADDAATRRNEALEKRLLLPKVVKAVNNDPEYASLRRAFRARIAAQWIRDRERQGRSTAYRSVIDSGDISRSRLTDGWKPTEVFDDYLKDLNSQRVKRTTREGGQVVVHTYIFGGVTLMNVPLTAVSAAAMQQQYPGLPAQVKASMTRPESGTDGSLWLGGTSVAADQGVMTRVSRTVRDAVAGKGVILVVVLLAFGLLVLGFRAGPRRPRTD